MQPAIKIAASILGANPVRLEEEIKKIEQAGIDLIHIDVMDGHFVPNITMGPFIVEGIRRITDVPLDIHLMIEHPERYVNAFAAAARAGDLITFHRETTEEPKEIVELIKKTGLKAGVSLNPDTPTETVEDLLDVLDLVLVMSVNPALPDNGSSQKPCQRLQDYAVSRLMKWILKWMAVLPRKPFHRLLNKVQM